MSGYCFRRIDKAHCGQLVILQIMLSYDYENPAFVDGSLSGL